MKKFFKVVTLALAGVFAMASCGDDVPAPKPNPNPGGGETEDTTVVVPAQGDGTQANPYNVAGVLKYIETLGADTESEQAVYVKGKVKSNSTDDQTIQNYGNMTFDVIDEGATDKVFKAFQVYGPGNKKFTAVSQIKEGDEVVIYGKVINFKGNTPETVSKGKAYVVSINGNGGDETPDQPGGEVKGSGTEADPYNVAGAIAYINTLASGAESDIEVYVKGKVSANSTTANTISQYGNMTFDIIDEGNTSATFKAFQVYGPNKQKFTAVSQIKVGDEVVVCGKVTNYMGNTPETVGKGQAYVVTINGKAELPDDGGEEPQPGEPSEFSIDLPCTMGTNAYNDGKATINGVSDVSTVKIGTSKAAGNFTVTMPAGKHTFYAVTWKGAGTADVTFSNGETLVKTVTVKENAGAAGNAPYTLTVTDDDKYEIEVAEETTLTVTSDKRVIFFGIK